MVRRALALCLPAVPAAFGLGWLAAGPGAGASALIGVALVTANFSAHGLSLAWASTVSIPAVHAVALGGFATRIAVLVAAMLALNALDWFSPLAFGIAVVSGTLLLLAFEARLQVHGMGGSLQVPADPAAARASEALAAREV